MYYLCQFAGYRAKDIVAGRYRGNPFAYDGFYRIGLEPPDVSDFLYPCHVGKSHRRARIHGRYESEVMGVLNEHVSGGCEFWEVGAWRGYYSLAFADRAGRVVAFETREHPIKKLRAAAERNGYGNITVVNDLVESLDRYIKGHGKPDVVLLDIEGWEYDVLSSSPEFLDANPVLIVEVHEESGWISGEVVNPRNKVEEVKSPVNIDPEGVAGLLESHGYEIELVQKRRDSNYHFLAVPE